MAEPAEEHCRFFVSYTGVKLPFTLVNAIETDGLSNRNTFIRAYFDPKGVLRGFDKMVYGEVELSHRYAYHPNGRLKRAEIVMLDEEPAALSFDETGAPRSDADLAAENEGCGSP
ncbi:MAG: hypothetical protein B7Y12_12460 [Rhizobiales bacterium 24-66-13]|jgi:hypothetical protein|nr:MAG: hypothetical protein B7Y61_13680 [Rhizobiales bacterium 35-66-30]OYZ75623.1 MAG: hypothetical protein B7Y12_12460 [Rhizobiales bacterium 24-66-13]OZA95458.1 MAG: hypothetical protein B7X67_25540 [Rhizobiales bacterium 39-66-18]HQS10656.1 DUF6156 family protein [Xanthobacteraceae bacterium]HQS48642.1 DUF6156 family protein [Xanthobacteraceae bacterium]